MERYSKSYIDIQKLKPKQTKGGFFNQLFKRRSKTFSGPRSFDTASLAPIGEYSSYIRKPNFVSRADKTAMNKKNAVIILLTILGISWLGLMLYLPFFRVYNIEYTGLKLISKDEIDQYTRDKYLKSGILPKNNYFLVNKRTIELDLSNKYAIRDVEVKKVFPHKLEINITEKITSLIYDDGKSYFLLDSTGTVIKELAGNKSTDENTILQVTTTSSNTETSTSTGNTNVNLNTSTIAINIASTSPAENTTTSARNLEDHKPDYHRFLADYLGVPIMYNKQDQPIYVGQTNVVSSKLIIEINNWQAELDKRGIGSVRYFESGNIEAGIKAILNKDWYILIQPENDLEEQISNLQIIISDHSIKPAEYIDLRFNERLYWK